MTIKQGYNGELTRIKINVESDFYDDHTPRVAQVWLDQEGLLIEKSVTKLVPIEECTQEEVEKAIDEMRVVQNQSKQEFVQVRSTVEVESETMSYATLDELLNLRDEVKEAIRLLVGL
jgi:hypothetical protein